MKRHGRTGVLSALLAGLCLLLSVFWVAPAHATYRLTFVEATESPPLCVTRFAVENTSSATLLGLNAVIQLNSASGPVGTSRGLLIGPVSPGQTLIAEASAANLPCGQVESYTLVVEGCQTEAGSIDRVACAAAFQALEPFTSVIAR
ncbi:MAG: hypothetical protein AAF590_02440 [Pseudomonadota bacterium]